jgi:hypothetical protein
VIDFDEFVAAFAGNAAFKDLVQKKQLFRFQYNPASCIGFYDPRM